MSTPAYLEQLARMCVMGLGDAEPHVRWAACQALGQMCTDLGPELQVGWGICIENTCVSRGGHSACGRKRAMVVRGGVHTWIRVTRFRGMRMEPLGEKELVGRGMRWDTVKG